MRAYCHLRTTAALLLLALCSGCSLLGGASRTVLHAGVASWRLTPAALREAQPDFIRGVYFNAEIMISDAADWRFFVDTRTALAPEVLDTAHVEMLVYHNDEWQTVISPLRLISRHSGELLQAPEAISTEAQATTESSSSLQTGNTPQTADVLQTSGARHAADIVEATPEQVAAPATYRHVFALADAGLQTWHSYQQQLWDGQRPKLKLPLTPRFSENIADQVLRLEYQFASSFPPAPLAPTARLLMRMGGRYFNDEDFDRLCSGSDFPYDKRALCGSTVISEDTRAGIDQ